MDSPDPYHGLGALVWKLEARNSKLESRNTGSSGAFSWDCGRPGQAWDGLWNGQLVSVRELAGKLQKDPANVSRLCGAGGKHEE